MQGGRTHPTSPSGGTPVDDEAALALGAASRPVRGLLSGWSAVALLAVSAITGAGLAAACGREAWGAVRGLAELARQTWPLAGWVIVAGFAAAVAVVLPLTWSVAFARRRGVRVASLAVVVLGAAAPGVALGWVDATVGAVGRRDAEARATVTATKRQLATRDEGEAVTILVLGADDAGSANRGRSDSQILVRLDPKTKTMSMLSLPRDLRVYVPGVGYTKLNAAYASGGAPLAVKVIKDLTGLSINHFICVDFDGFWQAVDRLGGVYLSVDHRYYVPAAADYKSIDLQPGYQLLRAKQALDYVRYRYDQKGDFTRMVRQQVFLREVQRQAGRWSRDWTRVVRMVEIVTREATSDIDSLARVLPIINLALDLDTSRIHMVHVEGGTPTIDGVSYVVATEAEIAAAVRRFLHPATAARTVVTDALVKSTFRVEVRGTSSAGDTASETASLLRRRGYSVSTATAARGEVDDATVVYAPRRLARYARAVAQRMPDAEVRLVERSPGCDGVIRVFLGGAVGTTSANGAASAASTTSSTEDDLRLGVRQEWTAWRTLAARAALTLQAPTSWAEGLAYEQFRSYRVLTTSGKQVAAAAVTGTYGTGHWGIQALRWTDAPAVADPDSTLTLDGRTYLLFFQSDRLHMVAWRQNGTLYWVVNTLADDLSDTLMLSLARSCLTVTP